MEVSLFAQWIRKRIFCCTHTPSLYMYTQIDSFWKKKKKNKYTFIFYLYLKKEVTLIKIGVDSYNIC